MRSIPQSFYKSKEWKICRQAYLSSVGGLCERCKAQGRIVSAEIVHHKIHLTEENYHNPEISMNFENLEALCQDCHNKEHFDYSKPRWKFVDGVLITKELED